MFRAALISRSCVTPHAQIQPPRYRGQFNYDSASTRGTTRLAASDGLPVLLADHVNEPGLPNRLGPGLTLDGEALCDMARFELPAMRTAVVNGRTRRWRVSVYWHASLEEWITGVLPAYELLHHQIHDGETDADRVRKALDHAISHCVLGQHQHADETTHACVWMAAPAAATGCIFSSQSVETLVSQGRREAGLASVHRSW